MAGAEENQGGLTNGLGRAVESFAAGNWDEAKTRLQALAEREPVAGDVLTMLAVCEFHLESPLEAARLLERAFTAFLAEDNQRSAVMCTSHLCAMHEMLGGDAAVQGWYQRGMRLVESIGPCAEAGYLALAQTGCEVVDPRELERRAELALDVAVQFGDRDLEVRARADKGLALVSQGFVNAGFVLLDEVMVALLAGEVKDPDVCGRSVCSVLSACERVGDIGRLEYWCTRIDEEPILHHPVLFSHCRLVLGVAEALRGHYDLAESHLVVAMEAPTSGYGHRVASAARLAEIRLQQGRYEDAAALVEGFEDRVEAIPLLARLRLHQGQTEQASALLRSAVRSLGEDAMRLAPLLALAVEVELARGNADAATRHHARLVALDARCESNELRAYTRLSAGRLARHQGDAVPAVDELETALALLTHYDRPQLTAQIRLELAKAFAEAGDRGAAMIEAEAALSTFRRLGNVHDAAGVEAMLKSAGGRGPSSSAPNEARPPTDGPGAGLTAREREVAALVSRGMTNREIADELVLSVRTVEGHVDRILGKLNFHTRTQLALWAGQQQL